MASEKEAEIYVDENLNLAIDAHRETGKPYIYCSGAEAKCTIPTSIAKTHSIICHGATSEIIIVDDEK